MLEDGTPSGRANSEAEREMGRKGGVDGERTRQSRRGVENRTAESGHKILPWEEQTVGGKKKSGRELELLTNPPARQKVLREGNPRYRRTEHTEKEQKEGVGKCQRPKKRELQLWKKKDCLRKT